MAALQKAAEVRTERAELKVQLKSGSLTFAELLRRSETDHTIATTKILTIIESLPAVGKVKARRTMAAIGISESRRVRGLGKSQRSKLLEAFG